MATGDPIQLTHEPHTYLPDGSFDQSVSQSINQSINQSVNQSVNQSISQSVNQSVNQSITQSNQSISQSVSQSTNQSIKSISQSLSRSISQSVSQSINQSMNCRTQALQATPQMVFSKCASTPNITGFHVNRRNRLPPVREIPGHLWCGQNGVTLEKSETLDLWSLAVSTMSSTSHRYYFKTTNVKIHIGIIDEDPEHKLKASPQKRVAHFITPTELPSRSLHHTDRVAQAFISSHRQSCDQTLRCLHRQAPPHKHVCSFLQTLNRTRSLDEAAHDETRARGTHMAIDDEGENEDEVDDLE